MASIEQLFTREQNNQSERMALGKSGEWLEVLGTDSDLFQKAKRQVNLDVVGGKLKPEQVEVTLVAALITAWSFDEPCTDDNKIKLLANSPSLKDAIDRAASKRADFLGKLPAGSKATQKKNSG